MKICCIILHTLFYWFILNLQHPQEDNLFFLFISINVFIDYIIYKNCIMLRLITMLYYNTKFLVCYQNIFVVYILNAIWFIVPYFVIKLSTILNSHFYKLININNNTIFKPYCILLSSIIFKKNHLWMMMRDNILKLYMIW